MCRIGRKFYVYMKCINDNEDCFLLFYLGEGKVELVGI